MPPVTTSSVTGPLGGANRRGRQVQQQLVQPQQAGGFPAVTPVPGQGGVPGQQSFGDFGIGRALDRIEQRKLLQLTIDEKEEKKTQGNIVSMTNALMMKHVAFEVVLSEDKVQLGQLNSVAINDISVATEESLKELAGFNASIKKRGVQGTTRMEEIADTIIEAVSLGSTAPFDALQKKDEDTAAIRAAGGFPVLVLDEEGNPTGGVDLDNVEVQLTAGTMTNWLLQHASQVASAGLEVSAIQTVMQKAITRAKERDVTVVGVTSSMMGIPSMDSEEVRGAGISFMSAVDRIVARNPTVTPAELMQVLGKETGNPLLSETFLDGVNVSFGDKPPQATTPDLEAIPHVARAYAKFLGVMLRNGEKVDVTIPIQGTTEVAEVKDLAHDPTTFTVGNRAAIQNFRMYLIAVANGMTSSAAGQVASARILTVKNFQRLQETLEIAKAKNGGRLSAAQAKLILNATAEDDELKKAFAVIQNPIYQRNAELIRSRSFGPSPSRPQPQGAVGPPQAQGLRR